MAGGRAVAEVDSTHNDSEEDPFEKDKRLLDEMHAARHGPRPPGWADCIPWPLPAYWDEDPKGRELFAKALPYLRPPHNKPHPDLFHVQGRDGTLLRGKYCQPNAKAKVPRVPDVHPAIWDRFPKNREQWRLNWEATGDYQRESKDGPAPDGWSSFQAYKVPAAPVAPRCGTAFKAGVGRLATWSKWNYAARKLQTTHDPVTFKDGGADLGPKSTKVLGASLMI